MWQHPLGGGGNPTPGTSADTATVSTQLMAANTPEGITIGGAWTAVFGSLILLIVFYLIGRAIPGFKKFDDVLRVLIAFFGVTGVLAIVPPFSGYRSWAQDRIGVGTQAAGSNGATFWWVIGVLILGAIGFYVFYHRGRIGQLLAFVALTLPMFAWSALFDISGWYAKNIGTKVFEFVAGFFTG